MSNPVKTEVPLSWRIDAEARRIGKEFHRSAHACTAPVDELAQAVGRASEAVFGNGRDSHFGDAYHVGSGLVRAPVEAACAVHLGLQAPVVVMRALSR